MKKHVVNLVKYFKCTLFHQKTPYWDGSFTPNEEGIIIEKIRWVCEVCDESSNEDNK